MGKIKEFMRVKLNNLLDLDYKISAINNDMDIREKQYLQKISALKHENYILNGQMTLLNEKEKSLHRTMQSILNVGIDADIPNNRGVSDSWE